MFKTRITEMLGIEYPILAGGLAGLSRAELVAAEVEAGIMGFLISATFDTLDEFREEIRKCKALTSRPFGVNFNLFPGVRPLKAPDYARVALEEGIRIYETSGRNPEELFEILKGAGADTIVMHKCARTRDAITAQRLGADIVGIVGFECGGHPPLDYTTTMVMVPRVAESVTVPVAAGGGIADGRGLVAALALGAEAVIIGTRFMASPECPLHNNLKQAIVDHTEVDTAYIMRSFDNPTRAFRNRAAEQILEMEARGASIEEVLALMATWRGRSAAVTGDPYNSGTWGVGQVMGIIHDIKPVKQIVDDIVREAEEVMARLNAANVATRS